MPKSEEAKALDQIAAAIKENTKALRDILDELRSARRDRIRPGG